MWKIFTKCEIEGFSFACYILEIVPENIKICV